MGGVDVSEWKRGSRTGATNWKGRIGLLCRPMARACRPDAPKYQASVCGRKPARKTTDQEEKQEILLRAKGRGERGLYGLLKERLKGWLNARFFCAGLLQIQKVKVKHEKNCENWALEVGGDAVLVKRFPKPSSKISSVSVRGAKSGRNRISGS